MDALTPDDLYEERNGVSYARPILQGDVFENVIVPGLGDTPLTVQVVMHPCSMRRGVQLVQRIQVAPVGAYEKVGDWDRHLRVMPLPDLREDGNHYAAKFLDTTAVPASSLTLENRIASLSRQGILVLQQRIVKDHARLDLPLNLFLEQSAPVLTEAEMQESWVEAALGVATALNAADVEVAATDFQNWLDEEGGRRRKALESDLNHADLRREVRTAASERRAQTSR